MDDEPGPSVVSSQPSDGEEDVPRSTPYFIDFDTRLLPRSVARTTVRVESGVVRQFLSVRFDPVDQRIIAQGFGGEMLEPFTTYRLVVDEVRDLDDVRIAEPFEVAFRTNDEVGEAFSPTTATWSEVEPILTERCAGSTCHGPGRAVLGLDLSSGEGVRRTAIGTSSLQVRAGTVSVEGAGGAFGLAALPRIDVVGGLGRPGSSYLLYKVLGDPHIIGEPMPPAGPPLERAELRIIADWILAGAPTR